MAIISGLRPAGNLIEVICDGRTVMRLRPGDMQKLPLHIGEDLDISVYTERVAAIQINSAYETALRALDRSSRTCHEIRQILSRKGFVEPAIDEVISRLVDNHILDDMALARYIVENQMEQNRGIFAVKRKLRSKGISEDNLDEVLDVIDDEQQRIAAKNIAARILPKYAKLDSRAAKSKLVQALVRRGFSWDNAKLAAEEVLPDSEFYD